MNKFMKIAVNEAFKGMRKGDGGPFGAVIVKDGKIIARGHNMVLSSHDPSAHAEVTVIRKASKKLKRSDLSDCELYTSCEPCPMCLGAIYWASIKKIYYGCKENDAADIGFKDLFIHEILTGDHEKIGVIIKQIDRDECLKPFKEWKEKKDKTIY